MPPRVRLLAGLVVTAAALAAAPEDLQRTRWRARWIAAAEGSPTEFGVGHFRRTLTLDSVPQTFVVHVTADQRYRLFVNGQSVAFGPARGDLNHWRFDTVDLAPHLHQGENVVAAVVWNLGTLAPIAQWSHQTGFLLQGDTAAEQALDTSPAWRAIRNEAYAPVPVTWHDVQGYWAAGPIERVEGSRYPWQWEQPGYDDGAWAPARVVADAAGREASDSPSRWMLVPRSIPAMAEWPERLARVRQADNVVVPARFPIEPADITVAARQKATLLLDHDQLTTGYPELVVSGGSGATVRLQYAEALYVPGTREKGNRDEVEGKEFVGPGDLFLPDGGRERSFAPLWWRTWRYLLVTVETAAEPLTLHDLRATATRYPFERKARFASDRAELDRILDVGWHTARLCAHETYMDCPYYEQLQYVGDTRIQALVSYYMSGDGRLARNAIEQLDSSRTAEGLTLSRAPSALQQYIPPFSLWWIAMVHDYSRYQDDPGFVARMLPGVRAVLEWFAARRDPDGHLREMPWWNFVDWAREWPNGVPPIGKDGGSAPWDLQLLLATEQAADLEQHVGSAVRAQEHRVTAASLRAAIRRRYWSEREGLFADTTGHDLFSQHTNALALLAGLVPAPAAPALAERMLTDARLVPASVYFRHYLNTAVAAAGLGDRYVDLLDEWRGMLARGLTTWAESYEPSRSDCHAWGSSPNVELFRTVLGIDSAAPGFRKVRIAPHLGALTRVSGTVPHPQGEIAVSLERQRQSLLVDIALPPGVEGEFVWNGEVRPIRSGQFRVVGGLDARPGDREKVQDGTVK